MKKLNQFLGLLAVLFTNLFFTAVSFLEPILSHLIFQIRSFIKDRKPNKTSLSHIKFIRDQFTKSAVFYCSSAGEYEQAKPIADALSHRGFFIHFLFFSDSGFKFAKLRKESLSYSLAPLDTLLNWREFFEASRPDFVIVVRHELWPCFLYEAKKVATLILVNSSLKSKGCISLFIKRILFQSFDLIFAISESEKKSLIDLLSIPINLVKMSGDTKYDRVIDRVKICTSNGKFLFPEFSQKKKKIIIGSAWRADCELVLKTFTDLLKRKSDVQLIITPHQPTDDFIMWVQQQCNVYKLSSKLFSQHNDSRDTDVVIVDRVGILFEIYSVADLAFVGGGIHHKIHNVLEPAAFGLYLGFGPKISNSDEASEIVSRNFAKVIRNNRDCLNWMTESLEQKEKDLKLQKFIEKKTGASSFIITEILSQI